MLQAVEPFQTDAVKRAPVSTVVDVAIVGGGPAGCAAAIALTRHNRQVIVLERSHYDTTRAGENLSASARPLLGRLGVLERIEAAGHLPSFGILAAWGEHAEQDSLHDPYGHGWHIDRQAFDLMMAHAASEAGSLVLCGAALKECKQSRDGHWRLTATLLDSTAVVEARFLVDATGRNSPGIRMWGGTRVVYDRLIGLLKVFQGGTRGPRDARTIIEAVENGWWYSVPLSGDRLLAGFLTDADQLGSAATKSDACFQESLCLTRWTQRRVAEYATQSAISIVPAFSYIRRDVIARNRLCVGDAASAFDPLSGSGLAKAMESSLRACDAIHAHLAGDEKALEDYGSWVAGRFAKYWERRSRYYCIEDRWPESPFWKRRGLETHKPKPLLRQTTRLIF